MKNLSRISCALVAIGAVALTGCRDIIKALSIVEVSSPAINCVFDRDCTIPANDYVSVLSPPDTYGQGFVQSRLFPAGEPGTQAEGLYAYLYRIDLSEVYGSVVNPHVKSFTINFGPVVPLDYDGDGALEDAFVITGGGLGSVQPLVVDRDGDRVTFSFPQGITVTQSSFFFGLTSVFPARETEAEIVGFPGWLEAPSVRTPNFVSSTEPVVDATDTGNPSKSMLVRGAGFLPGGFPATVYLDDQPISTIAIPFGGALSKEITLPAGTAAGNHVISVSSWLGKVQLHATTTLEVTPTSSVSMKANGSVLWNGGVLQSSTDLKSWKDLPNAPNPYPAPTGYQPKMFFRVKTQP